MTKRVLTVMLVMCLGMASAWADDPKSGWTISGPPTTKTDNEKTTGSGKTTGTGRVANGGATTGRRAGNTDASNVQPEKVYEVGEVTLDLDAEFPGGNEAMVEWLTDSLKYPRSCYDEQIGGRVIVEVIVNKDGRLGSAKIVRGVHKDIDREALRLVRSMPTWEPAMYKGKVVRVKKNIVINFNPPRKRSAGDKCYAQGFRAFQHGNIQEALRIYQEGADMGDANCLNALGTMYFNGDGVTSDHSIACKYFERAANLGQMYAALTLAQCYFYGDGVAQDYNKAFNLFSQWADKDDSAIFNMAQCYELGRGAPLDKQKALQLYQSLIDKNSHLAGAARERISNM